MKKIILLLITPFLLLANDKNVGLEINPFRLVMQESDYNSFSGSLSIFLPSQNAELRFPLYWSKETYDNHTETTTTLDAEYRYFINGSTLDGMFLGAVARVAKLDNQQDNKSTTKFGAGVSLGYRYIPENSNWYWGMSISVIRYISGENHIFGGGGIDTTWIDNDTKGIIDIDFFKVGYRF